MLLDIFHHEQSYDNDYESFCGKNCIRQVLEYYGVKNAPFFINSALGLTLVRNEEAKSGYDKQTILGGCEDKLCLHVSDNKSAIEVWEENKARVKEGIPIITGVDIFYFHYTPHFHKFHSDHRVILCGYPDAGNNATIIDHYQWKFTGDIEIHNFLEARSSLCPKDDGPYSGTPTNNFWFEIDKNGWNVPSEELLFETISRSLRQYYYTSSDYQANRYEGIEALKKLLEIIIEQRETGKGDDSEFLSEVRLAFLFVYTRIKLFKYYMQISLSIAKRDLLSQIKDQMVEEIKIWETLIRFVLKCMYTKEDSLYVKIIGNFNKIIDMEEKRYDFLEKLVKVLT
jgi:hypothetical protein